MKIKTMVCLTLTAGLLGGGLTACVSERAERARLEAKARITRAEAEKTALAQVPNGTVKEGDIEEEDGKVIWSFDIATPGAKDITEVAVDAVTGKVVAVDKESPEAEAKERAADAKGEDAGQGKDKD